MEDSHSVHLYMPPPGGEAAKPSNEEIPTQPAGSTVTNDSTGVEGNALFGVFDGHGGSSVAKFTGTTIHKRLSELDSYRCGDYEGALKETFLKTDEDLRADPNFFNEPSGCTAVVGLVTKDGRIIVANSGDSRSVLGYKGVAKAMSNDHKPTNKEETSRITAAGGFVEFGRVNGNLALSRAIGDFEFKQNMSLDAEKQIVTADPEIITHKIDSEEEFLVLACDGIWDCLTSQQVVDIVRRAVANGDELGKICEDLMVKCLATDSETGGIGCDNMTVVVVALLNGRTPDEWREWVKERVLKKVGHDTPESVPDIFGQNNGGGGAMSAFGGGFGGAGGFRIGGAGGLQNINLSSILGASGISFRPTDDSDDEDDGELHIIGDDEKKSDGKSGEYLDNKALEKGTKPVDVTDKLDSLPSKSKKGSVELVDEDGDSTMDSGEESDETTTGEQSKPAFTSIGSPNVPSHKELLPLNSRIADSSPQEQLKSEPEGDKPSAAVKAEGLMDTSEDPLKL